MLPAAIWCFFSGNCSLHADEPAAEFIKRLRAARYFDTAIAYLDRIDQYPGVDPELIKAIALEKAQTFIDAAGAARSNDARIDSLGKAEQQLTEFLKQSDHPRTSEARLQLGKLQMLRAMQLMAAESNQGNREEARESFLAAAATFDTILENLRGTLKEMQGARIDPSKDPKQAALRDRYRGEFLQAMSSAGEARHQAARTFQDPGTQGKELLEQALEKFTDLSENYDRYAQGAVAMLHRGEIYSDLGKTQEAMDSYMRMMEQPEADPLRLAKFQATTGIMRLQMAETPPKYQPAIDRGQPLLKTVRPNERNDPILQEFRLGLADAYLAKSKDKDNQKPADLKRSESEGRKLLITASKIPGSQAEKAKQILAELGIELDAVADLPTTEDPTTPEEALERTRELLDVIDQLTNSMQVLEAQENPSESILAQIKSNQDQASESRMIAIQLLRRGLALVTIESDAEVVNQLRYFLTYLLYQEKMYPDASVVGTFLTFNAPGADMGLRGGILALNSLQLLLVESPDNGAAIRNLKRLGAYLTKTWPNDPDAASAQGAMIRLALKADRWDESRDLIGRMPPGAERATFQRLMGQLLWNKSIQKRNEGDVAESDRLLTEAAGELQSGLNGIPDGLVGPEAIKAALVLAKVRLKQGKITESYEVLENDKYGPVVLIKRQGAPDDEVASDLYRTQLQVLVQRMTTESGDTKPLLEQASEAMDKLRKSITGPDAQKELTRTYMLMARDIREQLDAADPVQKAKLVEAFRVFLDRIAVTTDDEPTLGWVGQTLMELAQASMPPGTTRASGLPADLLTTAVQTFGRLSNQDASTAMVMRYQLGRAHRMLGDYKSALKVFEALLKEKPTMLDAQTEAALAYEQWAATAPPQVSSKVYDAALAGARPDAKNKNVIWGWGKISQETSRNPKFQDRFFNARYHVALCRFLSGKANSDPTRKEQMVAKAVTDITRVAALYPELGGPEQRAKFDALLKLIQKELRQPEVGLPPL